jgi:hypothetical protein
MVDLNSCHAGKRGELVVPLFRGQQGARRPPTAREADSKTVLTRTLPPVSPDSSPCWGLPTLDEQLVALRSWLAR